MMDVGPRMTRLAEAEIPSEVRAFACRGSQGPAYFRSRGTLNPRQEAL